MARKPWVEVVAVLWWDACMHRDNPDGTAVPIMSFGILGKKPAKCGGLEIYPEISASGEIKDKLVIPVGMQPCVVKLVGMKKPPEFRAL